ncbi:MAG: hypothetical protein LN412_08120 [Candidatus Thermoplasmatota archaeon]|nr:hypothetical protein [Candidatus Thermoplasmatota archaeon]
MESSNVLVALEEWERWRSRKAKLERELRDLRQQRKVLHAKLESVKRELGFIEEALFEPLETSMDASALSLFQAGR